MCNLLCPLAVQVHGSDTAYVEKSHIYEAELTLDPSMWQRAPLCHHLDKVRSSPRVQPA